MTNLWSSVDWKSFPNEGQQLGWSKEQVPFLAGGNALQTFDVWMSTNDTNTQERAPTTDSVPAAKGPWVIYIHGGAWRDPAIFASSFTATVKHLLSNQTARTNIAGFASLSYSLSPHPKHPDNPSPPQDPNKSPDPSRLAKHPDHIQDVLAGLAYLQQKAGFGSNYLLIGHSCGATLALQAAMDHSNWNAGKFSATKPRAILGLNGLYDLPELLRNPGPKHQAIQPVYDMFTRIAFGEDEGVWRAVSPQYVQDWDSTWDSGKLVVLAQSHEDSLVPYAQTEAMLANLKKSGPPKISVGEAQVHGDHNEVWQHGQRLAEIVLDMIKEM